MFKGASQITTARATQWLSALFLAICLALASTTPMTQAESGDNKSAAQAAKEAKSRYGGKVVGVNRSGKHYKVKLIQKDGRVITVTISEN